MYLTDCIDKTILCLNPLVTAIRRFVHDVCSLPYTQIDSVPFSSFRVIQGYTKEQLLLSHIDLYTQPLFSLY
jgi:hypothetical protein